MRKLLALAVLCAGSVAAQDTWIAPYEETLASGSVALSVQLPATGSANAKLLEATVQCLDAACDIKTEVNGSAASTGTGATAVTLVALDPELAEALGGKIQAWRGTGSQIPTGTVIGPTNGWRIVANGLLPLGGGRNLTGQGTSRNYILRITPAAYPCTVRIMQSWTVRR